MESTGTSNSKEVSWKCSVCHVTLSRKQRLRSHYEKFHAGCPLPEDVDYPKKKYKGYILDSSVPVPKRTKLRHGQKKENEDGVPSDKPGDIKLPCLTEHSDSPDLQMDLTDSIDLNMDSSDMIEESPVLNNFASKMSEPRKETVLSHSDEQRLAILSYISRMKLTGTAAESFMRLLHVLDCHGLSNVSLDDLRATASNVVPKCHIFCQKCKVLFPDDGPIEVCGTTGCGELRSKGNIKKASFASLSIEQQLIDIFERQGVLESLGPINHITMTFNTDGVPLYNSSAVSLWPVYLVINELAPKTRFLKQNIIIWGIWQGRGKPEFHTYLQPFVEQLLQLKHEGFLVNLKDKHHLITAELTVGTLDLQAKAYLMDMTQHNGMHGCIACEEPGQVVSQGKGHTRAYPANNNQASARSIDSVLTQAEEAIKSKKAVKGIKGVSVLFDLDYYDPIQYLVPDYMHGVLLGTTKKLLNLWFSTRNSKQPFFLGNRVHEVDKRLMAMQPTDKITRLPRSIERELQHWKASEFQNWLLYYGVPCLEGIMEVTYFENFCCLVEGIYLLLCESLTIEDLDRARQSLRNFQESFQVLYGLNNCGLNIHNIGCHLADSVSKHGPLWAWSCFPFEDMNGLLLKSCHGTGDVCKQLLSYFHADKRLVVQAEHMSDGTLKEFTSDMLVSGKTGKNLKTTNNCKVAGKVKHVQVQDQQVLQHISKHVNLLVTSVGEVLRINLRGEVICSMEYTRMEKRIGFAVLFKGQEDSEMGLVKHLYHETMSDLCFAEIVCFKNLGLVNSSVGHIIKVETSAEKRIIPVQEIVEKLLFLQGNPDCVCICRMPNLYGQCG